MTDGRPEKCLSQSVTLVPSLWNVLQDTRQWCDCVHVHTK